MDEKRIASIYHHPSEDLDFAPIPSEYNINPEYAEFIEPAKLASVYHASAHAKYELPLSPVASSRSSDEYQGLHSMTPSIKGLAKEAREATQTEHRMTVTEALCLYKKAIGWSALLSLTLVMEGFDITLITSFFAFPSFKRDYGAETPKGYQISTGWQAALTNGALAGEIIGLFLNGFLTDKFGNRKTMMLSLFCLTTFISLAFFAQNLEMLLASQVLCGIPWGIFQTLSTTYATECMPVALRAYLTSSINLCWLIGQAISAGTLRGLTHDTSAWSYRLPFALQWMWIPPILVGVLFAPESPWWLIKHERPAEAKRSIQRLTTRSSDAILDDIKADQTIALMQHTNEVEKRLSTGTGYLDCFRGSDLRRTEIACMTWMTQSICGIMTGYATYFYSQAGLSTDKAFSLSAAMYGAGILGVFLSWGLMHYAGRRTLYLWGCALIAAILLAAGIIGALQPSAVSSFSSTISWILGTLTILITFIYDSTVGPVCYSLVSEIPSTRLRVKTVVLARVAYNILSIVTNVLMPHLLNPMAWNWRGKTCLLWAGVLALAWFWCWARLPEPKGLTFIELDLLFEKGAGARKFGKVRRGLVEGGYFDVGGGSGKGLGLNSWGRRVV